MKNKRLLLLPATIAAGFNLLAPNVHAAAITWDAGGANNNWSTVNNWSDNAAATGDDVTFNATGAAASGTTNTVDASISIASLSYIQESATLQHTTAISAGQTLTVAGNFLLGGGVTTTTPTNVTLSGSTGALAVGNGLNSTFQVGQIAPNTTVGLTTNLLDMSGLGTFTANLGSAGTFRLGASANTNTTGAVATVKLAATSSITANLLGVGDRAGRSGTHTLKLGSVANTIYANTVAVGSTAGRGNGNISFETGTGTLLLRAADGVAAVTTMNMVNNAFGHSAGHSAVVDFAGHNVDAKIGALNMALRTATTNGGATATFTFDTGLLEVGAVTMAKSGTATSTNAATNATINIGGGTASFAQINMAESNAANNSTTNAALNFTGGTITVNGNIIRVGGTGATTATLALSGATTVLDMTGKNITDLTGITYTSGLLKSLGTVNTGITLAGTGFRVFEQATGISGIIQGSITGTGLGLTKQGAGALNLAGANTYDGQTAITAGRLQLAKQASLYNGATGNWTAANINVKSGATLSFNVGGTDEFTTGNVTTLLTNLAVSSGATDGMNAGSVIGFDTTNASGGTFTIGDVITDTTGAGGGARGLTKLGTNTLTLTNDNTFTGNVTIATGELKIIGSSGLGIGPKTVNAQNLGFLSLDGSAGNISLASDLSITTAGLSIVNITGDNVINGIVKTIAGNGSSTIRSDAGSLNIVGNVDSGATGNRILELSGNSTGANIVSGAISNGTATLAVTKSGTGTWILSNDSNINTGPTNVNGGKLRIDGTTSSSSVVTATNAGTILGGNGTIGGATTMNVGTIHTAGDAVTLANITGAGTVDQVDFSTGITYNQGSIFEWNLTGNDATGIGTRGTNYDAVNTASLATTGTGAIFRVVLNAGQNFSEGFWNTDRTWTDIFENTTGTDLNIASVFGGGVQYYNASGEVTTVHAEQGSFSFSGTELRWAAVPEPTSALAGLLIGAGILRRRRSAPRNH